MPFSIAGLHKSIVYGSAWAVPQKYINNNSSNKKKRFDNKKKT